MLWVGFGFTPSPSMTVLIGLILVGYNFQLRHYLDSAGLFEIWTKEINPNSCLLSCSFPKFYDVLVRKNIIYTLRSCLHKRLVKISQKAVFFFNKKII